MSSTDSERPPRYAIVKAPSILGLFPKGVEQLTEALLQVGLAERLRARLAGQVDPPSYEPKIDKAIKVRNAAAIAAYSSRLADEIGPIIEAGSIPIVLGGDCSVLLGGLLCLRRKGRAGLLFMDAHADFYYAEPSGEGASMELAFATSRGPKVLTKLEGFEPLVREEDVAVLGRRDGKDEQENGSQRIEDTDIDLIELPEVRRIGMTRAVQRALAHLSHPELDGFWLHLDADVLSDAIMPAVDYRLPDGLSHAELTTALSAAVASGRLRGVTVTIYNPKLDKGGEAGRGLVDAVVKGLRA